MLRPLSPSASDLRNFWYNNKPGSTVQPQRERQGSNWDPHTVCSDWAQFFDKLVAWGGGESIRHVHRYMAPGFELVTFDPKTSISIIGHKAGIVGSFPAANARTPEELDAWLARMSKDLSTAENREGTKIGPYAVNLILRSMESERFAADLSLIEKHRSPIVITSVGLPGRIVSRVHAYGGLVFHDVATKCRMLRARYRAQQ